MANENIYITYNPYDTTHIGENTALRMQTIGHLYNLKVLLPFRQLPSFNVNSETERRITESAYTLFLNTSKKNPKWLDQEINVALKHKKPIIIVNDSVLGAIYSIKNPYIKEVQINSENLDNSLHEIAQHLRNSIKKDEKIGKIIGFSALAIALGLFVAALGDDE